MKFSWMKKSSTVLLGMAVSIFASALVFFSTHEKKPVVEGMDREEEQ